MRKTTKILIGVISSLLLLSMIYIVRQSFVGPVKRQGVMFSKSLDSMTLTGTYKTIKLVNIVGKKSPFILGDLNIIPATSSNKAGSFYLSKELTAFVHQHVVGDTLVLEFAYDKMSSNKVCRAHNSGQLDGAQLNLYLDPNALISVCNEIDGMAIHLKKAVYKQVNVNICSKLNVDSCQIESLSVAAKSSLSDVTISHSKVKYLSANLDHIYQWSMPKSVIEELNVTCSSSSDLSFSKAQCKKLNWKSKGKDARLNLTLSSEESSVNLE